MRVSFARLGTAAVAVAIAGGLLVASASVLPLVGAGTDVPVFIAPWTGRVLARGPASWPSVFRGPVAALAFVAWAGLATDELARVVAPGRARTAALVGMVVTQVAAAAKEVLYLTAVLQSNELWLTGVALRHFRSANMATLIQVLALGMVAALAQQSRWSTMLAAAPHALFHSRWLLNPQRHRGQAGWLLVAAWLGALALMR